MEIQYEQIQGVHFFSRENLEKGCNFLFAITASALQTDKSYNIKHGTTVNLVIYVLIWVPETAQVCNYFSALEKHLLGAEVEKRRGF